MSVQLKQKLTRQFCFVLVLAVVFLVFVTRTSLLLKSSSSPDAVSLASVDENALPISLTISNEYPQRLSKHWYAWDYIVEPYKSTTLEASSSKDDSDSFYEWVIEHVEDGKTVEDFSVSGNGMKSITYSFTRPTQVNGLRVCDGL